MAIAARPGPVPSIAAAPDARFGDSQRTLRREDPKLLTTGGTYIADLRDPLLDGAAYVTYVRSSVAHGRVLGIDTAEARALPDVIGVFTAEDFGFPTVTSRSVPTISKGLLAFDKVRFVGEPVAVVVSTTPAAGEDAADLVEIDYDILEPVIDLERAVDDATCLVYEELGSNRVFDSTEHGISDTSGRSFFDGCEVVVDGCLVNQRVAPCPLDVRGAAAVRTDAQLVLWTSTQGVQNIRRDIAETTAVPFDAIRVIAPDVGGGFGGKISCYPEESVLCLVADRLRIPLRWRETRSESMMNMGHGRAQRQYVAIGGTRAGRVTHYQFRALQDVGAFPGGGATFPVQRTIPMLGSVYDIAHIEARTTGVITNTTTITAYRGAGQPEAICAIERAMDMFAAAVGRDPIEIRRLNLIPPFVTPRLSATGLATYDTGDYETALDRLLAHADVAALRAEQQRRRTDGAAAQLGIGVCTYVKRTGGVAPFREFGRVEVESDGRIKVYTGSSPHGQGHATVFTQLVQERTGVPREMIELVWGDTELVPEGRGTAASKSLQIGGSSVWMATGELVEQARMLAADTLEADPADVVLDDARACFHVAGTPHVTLGWADLASIALAAGDQLAQDMRFESPEPTFPFGAHLAVVEVDTETGMVRYLRHVALDDCGRVVHPMIFDGQIHGGVAQGSAQALMEEIRYDGEGNPITSNLADYAFISAAEMPSIEVLHMETVTPLNPLGVKGVGEGGTVGAIPAVQSAVVDAVSHLGVQHIDMPCTAERVWRAIQAARRAQDLP